MTVETPLIVKIWNDQSYLTGDGIIQDGWNDLPEQSVSLIIAYPHGNQALFLAYKLNNHYGSYIKLGYAEDGLRFWTLYADAWRQLS